MPITNSSSPTPNHFGDLDGVRGLLAITVMLYHYGLNTFLNQIFGINPPGWGSCVDFFFVLSGFVICKSITANPVSIAQFSYKRFWRLFPIHIAILILFFPVLFKNGLQPTELFLNF